MTMQSAVLLGTYYYSITKHGKGQLKKKTEEWKVYSDAVINVLALGV